MIRNEELFKFRKEDEAFEKQRAFKYQGQSKRVSWSTNLLDIRTISPQTSPPCYFNDKILDKRWNEEEQNNKVNMKENSPELIEYQSTSYELFTTDNIKLVTRRESCKSYLRIR